MIVMTPVQADTHTLPQIGEGEDSPTLDGNITLSEWNSSVSFTTDLNGATVSVYVTTNTTHLFIGFNRSSTDFVAVNDTVPVYNSTIANYTLGYNNATHDWFAFVIDNNIDKATTPSTIGTSESPDDAIVIDRYQTGAYDAFADGNSTNTFIPDATQTYGVNPNTTILEGNNGTNNVDIQRNITSTDVYYELVKPLNTEDLGGYDFMLDKLGIFQFRLYHWASSVANDTLTEGPGTVDSSEWFSLRVNETGTGLSTQTPANTTINLINNEFSEDNLDGVKTVASLYGFDLSVQSSDDNITYSDYDLSILIFDENTEFSAAQLSRLSNYIRNGGNVVIMLGASSSAQDVADLFEIEYLSNSIISPVSSNETTSDITIDTFSSVLSLSSGENSVTSRDVSSITLRSHGIDASALGEKNQFIFGQEYMSYDLFTAPSDAVYDETDDHLVNDTESLEDVSMGIAVELLKGGRVSLIPSLSLVADGPFGSSDNALFFLRMLPWSAQSVDTLEFHSTSIDRHEYDEGDTVTITANVTDGFGNVSDELVVYGEIRLLGNTIKEVALKQQGDTSIYVAEFVIERNGFLSIEFTAQQEGYGFAEGDTVDLFVNADVRSFNDLADLSPITIIVFVLSVLIGFYAYTKARKD